MREWSKHSEHFEIHWKKILTVTLLFPVQCEINYAAERILHPLYVFFYPFYIWFIFSDLNACSGRPHEIWNRFQCSVDIPLGPLSICYQACPLGARTSLPAASRVHCSERAKWFQKIHILLVAVKNGNRKSILSDRTSVCKTVWRLTQATTVGKIIYILFSQKPIIY